MKPVDRMQKNDRRTVGSMARDTTQTKRAVDGVLDLVHAAADLFINAKTAKAIGVEIPATLLARADRIIE